MSSVVFVFSSYFADRKREKTMGAKKKAIAKKNLSK